MSGYLNEKIFAGKMNPEQHDHLVNLGPAPAPAPAPLANANPFILPHGFNFGQNDPLLNLPPNHYNLVDAEEEEQEEEDQELVAVEGNLGRMLTLADVDGYYLHKFRTGRSFKNRGYWYAKLTDFFYRIYRAYPEDVRSGAVVFNAENHDIQTDCYEAQLRRLDELVEEERMGRG